MKILLFGSTGATGIHVLRQALDQGIEVVAYVRSAGKIKIQDKRLKVVEGELSDIEKLKQALVGVDAVISALGVAKKTSGILPSESLPGMLEAMKQAGVKRYIGISSGAAVNIPGDRKPLPAKIMGKILGTFQGNAVADKRNELRILEKEEHVEWTLARPTRLVGDKLTKTYIANLHIPRRLWVSRADVAHFMLSQLNSREWINKAPFVS